MLALTSTIYLSQDGSHHLPPVVCVQDVATALQLPPVAYAAWLRELRARDPGAAADEGGEDERIEIDFKSFIDFLETGDFVSILYTFTNSSLKF
jgi:hypothetical protein